MSSNHSEHTSSNKNHSKEGSLPPRRSKHGRDNGDQTEELEKPRRFPFIQFWLCAFIALIAAFLVFYFWQEYQDNQSSVEQSYVDSVDIVNQQEQESPREVPEEDVSLEEDGDINSDVEQDENKEDLIGNKNEDKETSEEQVQDEETKEQTTEKQDQTTEEQDKTTEEPKKSQVIRTVHTIQEGETMYSITQKYFGSQDYRDYLAEFNGIKDIRDIQSGMKLNIPEKP